MRCSNSAPVPRCVGVCGGVLHFRQRSDQDLAILTGYMEEESSTDQDYFVETTAIDALASRGASADFVAGLRAAMGSSEGIDIVWSRD
jgi:hypothetical protein